jgi:hypothetical protein
VSWAVFPRLISYSPTLGTITHWFYKRRGFATGVATTASGIGGIMFSNVFGTLSNRIGFPWANRVLGFIFFCWFMISMLFIKLDYPQTNPVAARSTCTPSESQFHCHRRSRSRPDGRYQLLTFLRPIARRDRTLFLSAKVYLQRSNHPRPDYPRFDSRPPGPIQRHDCHWGRLHDLANATELPLHFLAFVS